MPPGGCFAGFGSANRAPWRGFSTLSEALKRPSVRLGAPTACARHWLSQIGDILHDQPKTSSQIVSFLTGIFITFFCFVGFESIAGLDLFGSFDLFISQLGINAHYVSMSRGVFDSRDAIYFLSVIAFFLILTKFRLGSRRW